MENNLNWQIKNNNGILYTVINQFDDKAILLGGNDYVVITDLSNFRKLHTWCGGKYFPHFQNKGDQIIALQNALTYFKHVCNYIDDNSNNDENEVIES